MIPYFINRIKINTNYFYKKYSNQKDRSLTQIYIRNDIIDILGRDELIGI